MKKKILLFIAVIASIMCLMAISASAENVLKAQNNNAYGKLSTFDSSITVGRTDTSYGFSPYIDAEGTTYARVVIGDGTTFYTFPTAYVLSNTTIYGEAQINTYVRDITSLNTAMETATGTNPGWTVDNIYRIELPYSVTRLNGGDDQGFQGYDNVVEIRLQPNSHVKDEKRTLLFWKCYALETIHNLDTFTFRESSLSGCFQECRSLTSLTFGYSAEVTTIGSNTFNGCTNLQSVNLAEAFPNLKTIGQTAFNKCSEMQYISLPTSLTYVGPQAFAYCTSLVFVDFNDNQNNINFDNYGHFQGCTALKAVSFSDKIQTLPNRMFAGCTSLQAVYLPSSLYKIGGDSSWDKGAFNDCSNLYFVEEAFDVRDENGNFYTAETFQMPAKPDVYYFPSGLTVLGTTPDASQASGCVVFRSCTSLNSVLVFPTGVVNVTPSEGMFASCGTQSNPKTIVFLGNMEILNYGTNSSRGNYITYILANENDTSIESVSMKACSSTSTPKEAYVYFCKGNCYYALIGGSGVALTTENTTKLTGSNHIADTKKSELISPATCVAYAEYQANCFCGHEMGKTYGTSYDLTNHNYDTANGATIVSISYNKIYTANGTKVIACGRDGCEEHTSITVAPIFTTKGYSIKETNGYGIISTYVINIDALKEYEDVNGAIKFGVIMANANFDGQTAFMSKDNEGEYVFNSNYGVQLEITQRSFAKVNATIDQFTQSEATLNLVMALYVIDGESVSYIQHEAAEGVNYAGSVTKDATLDVVTIENIAEINKIEIALPQPAVVPTGNDEE